MRTLCEGLPPEFGLEQGEAVGDREPVFLGAVPNRVEGDSASLREGPSTGNSHGMTLILYRLNHRRASFLATGPQTESP